MSRSRTRLAADWFAKLRLQGDKLTTQDDIDTENTIAAIQAEKDALAAQLASEAAARAQALADAEAARIAAVAAAEANAAAALAAEKAARDQALADAEAARIAAIAQAEANAAAAAAAAEANAAAALATEKAALEGSIATTVSSLVAAAPATLDTLNELAAAIGDDPNFATTMTNALAGKAAASHTHSIANVTGLQAALDGKALSAHTHIIADVTGLQSALDGKQASGSYLTTTGKAADSNLLDGVDSSAFVRNNNGAQSIGGNLSVSGSVTATGNVTAYSDRRLKTNIVPIPDALAKVQALGGYTYDRVDQEMRQTGVIAQEVLAVLPEAVTGSDEDMYGVNYGSMVGLLIEAIKELKAEVDTLKGA